MTPRRSPLALARRSARLLPGGLPRYVHCYDNGDRPDATFDRYTIVFTGRHRLKTGGGSCVYFGASDKPFHPQGFGQHGEAPTAIDWPTYGHLGRKLSFAKLPADVQRAVLMIYRDLWDLV